MLVISLGLIIQVREKLRRAEGLELEGNKKRERGRERWRVKKKKTTREMAEAKSSKVKVGDRIAKKMAECSIVVVIMNEREREK